MPQCEAQAPNVGVRHVGDERAAGGRVSVESLSIVLNHSRSKGVARLVLIGMANHDGDGGIWPSVERLKRYAGGVDRRTVQRAVEQLIALGELSRLVNEGGTRSTPADRRPNLYRLLLECPPDCDRTPRHNTRRGATVGFRIGGLDDDDDDALVPERVIHRVDQAQDGAAHTPPRGAAPVPPEPSLEPATKRVLTPALVRAPAHGWMHRFVGGRFCDDCGLDPATGDRVDFASGRITLGPGRTD